MVYENGQFSRELWEIIVYRSLIHIKIGAGSRENFENRNNPGEGVWGTRCRYFYRFAWKWKRVPGKFDHRTFQIRPKIHVRISWKFFYSPSVFFCSLCLFWFLFSQYKFYVYQLFVHILRYFSLLSEDIAKIYFVHSIYDL